MYHRYYSSYLLVLLQDEDLSPSDPPDLLSCSVHSTVHQPTLCWDLPQPSAAHVRLLVPTGNLLANARYVPFPLSVALIHRDPLEGLFKRSLTKPRHTLPVVWFAGFSYSHSVASELQWHKSLGSPSNSFILFSSG